MANPVVLSDNFSSYMKERFQDILRLGMEMGASDIFLKADHPPVFRVGSAFKPSSLPAPKDNELKDVLSQMVSPGALAQYQADRDLDFSLAIPGMNRFRVSVFQQRQAIAMVLRPIPSIIPTVESIQLPKPILEATNHGSGLFLVCGKTDSGKSTTIAAILEWFNHHRESRIITLENPIEFVFKDIKCDFIQREYRRDFSSFSEALNSSLRQDPDIILVGEMRDLESVELALKAAETGHLVFSTLNATSSSSVIDRICSMFAVEIRPFILEQLASTLVCVTTQILLNLADGSNRQIAAREILLNTPAISNLIRSGKQDQISSYLENSKEDGMVSMNADIERLVLKGLVKSDEARTKSPDPEGLMTRLSRWTNK